MGDRELSPVCEYCGADLPGRSGADVRHVCGNCLKIQRIANLSSGNAPRFVWTQSALAKHSQTTHAKYQGRLKWEAQFMETELQDVMPREPQRFIVAIFPRPQSCLYSRFGECCVMMAETADPFEIVCGRSLWVPHARRITTLPDPRLTPS